MAFEIQLYHQKKEIFHLILCAFRSTFKSQSGQKMLQSVHMGCSPWRQMLLSIKDCLFVAIGSYQLDEFLQP